MCGLAGCKPDGVEAPEGVGELLEQGVEDVQDGALGDAEASGGLSFRIAGLLWPLLRVALPPFVLPVVTGIETMEAESLS